MQRLLLVFLYLLYNVCVQAQNVYIKINDEENVFSQCTLQRTYLGTITDTHITQIKPLIIAGGTEIELQVDSFLVCFIINQNKHAFIQPLFISAGDSITVTPHKVKTENGYIYYKLIASGKNESNYNFLADTHSNYESYVAIDDKNTEEYIKHYKNKRDIQLDLLKSKKDSLSIPFYNYALAEIHNEYAWQMYRNGLENDANIIINSLSPYCYIASWEKFCYSFHEKEREKEDALNYLTKNYFGRPLEYLITNYIGWCVKNNIQMTPWMRSVTEKYVHDAYYLSCINFFEKITQISNKILPDSVLNETYLIEYKTNKKVTLKDFFDKQTNELHYIDFWASWCTGCRWIIREAKEGKEILKNEQKQLVYFSIDTDEQRWRKAVAEDEIENNPNYLIVNGNKSPLCKYIYLGPIPHYILVNKEGKLIKPQETRLEELSKK